MLFFFNSNIFNSYRFLFNNLKSDYMKIEEINNNELIDCFIEFVLNEKEETLSNIIKLLENAEFITPAKLIDGEHYDFLAFGSEKSQFRVPVFSNKDEYDKGVEHLKLDNNYEPLVVSIELFKNLAKNDESFNGLILDIHSGKYIIAKDILQIN